VTSRTASTVTRAERSLYAVRKDLQKTFPDPEDKDRLRYLAWALTYGACESGALSGSAGRHVRNRWHEALSELWPWERWLQYLRVAVLQLGARARRAGRGRNADGRQPNADFANRPDGRRDSGPRAFTLREAKPELGVNVMGYLSAEMGVGEAVRATIEAARAAGVGTSIQKLSTKGLHREEDERLTENAGDSYGVNVLHVNADQVAETIQILGPEVFAGKRNIGYWCWELEEFPQEYTPAFGYFDEIWTLSRFSQESIARRSNIPVVRIPPAVEVDEFPTRSRADFGIPKDAFVFLTTFDMLSVFERKNPTAVARAFLNAFGNDPTVHLVLKVNNAEKNLGAVSALREASVEGAVSIIDRTLPRAEVSALFQACDCLVSLHRAEGFGLTLAEAMYLGKPVIATAYSGNMDFTTLGNSFLVPYEIVPVPQGCDPYPPTAFWAEPSISHAVSQLRTVRADGEQRESIARAGQRDVRKWLSREAIGARIRERLKTIGSAAVG